jgi:hypothetical protein
MLDRRWDSQVRGWWNIGLAMLGERFLFVSLGICLPGLTIYWPLRRWVSTRVHWAPVIVAALSTISLPFCEINY